MAHYILFLGLMEGHLNESYWSHWPGGDRLLAPGVGYQIANHNLQVKTLKKVIILCSEFTLTFIWFLTARKYDQAQQAQADSVQLSME